MTPPPLLVAVPVITTGEPLLTVAPALGLVIVDVGGVSVEAVAATRPAWSEPGCALMSANRLTVACCMSLEGVVCGPSCVPSSPHDHCTVPAPNTRAPLAARYSVRV